MKKKLRIATAQFHVSANIQQNYQKIEEQITQAAERGVELIQFSECCLTGYPGIDIETCDIDPQIYLSLKKIANLAAKHNIWVIVGSHYYEIHSDKPLNALFVYNASGELVIRYDKRILAGAPGKLDRAWYRAGEQPAVFKINDVRCGLLICHEWRYPELFRQYQEMAVDLLFHSFYDGNLETSQFEAAGLELGSLITGSERFNAANNYLWLSVANTSKPEQVFSSMVIHPDGSLANQAKRNKEEIIITEIDLTRNFIDPSRYGRQQVKELLPNINYQNKEK